MPKKKKSIVSNWFLRKIKRKQNETYFEKETDEEKEKRLSNFRNSMSKLRSNESDYDKQIRLSNVRKTVSISRSRETSEQTINRLVKDRENKYLSRSIERINIDQNIRRSRAIKSSFYNIGKNDSTVKPFYIGNMNSVCNFCNAIFFEKEQKSDKLFSQCCNRDKVKLEPMKQYPECFKRLLTDKNNKYHINYLENIRSYNSSLAFASMGACIQPPKGYGPYCFRIHGQIYHRVSPAKPQVGENPQYGQLYILDTDEAVESRIKRKENTKCDQNLLKTIDSYLRKNNPYAKAYKMMGELENEEILKAAKENRSVLPVMMHIKSTQNMDLRRYNAPIVNEVAIVFNNVDGEPPYDRAIRVHLRSENKTSEISTLNPHCDSLIYPLLFPNGELGWNDEMKLKNSNARLTQLDFYSHRLSVREEFNPLLNAGKLTQQFIVDAYVKIEGNRLKFIKENQKRLRVEHYKGLMDHIHNPCENKNIKLGKRVILPSTFIGSPRAMQQNYQDAMALVRKFGKPDLFITMTCNPKWIEITENLKPWQRSEYRPDLIARVFKLKLKELKIDLFERNVLGQHLAHIDVIEFQKRGLPHCHILMWLQNEDRLHTSNDIDEVVCAEIPNTNQTELFKIVTSNMIHGPCRVCLVDGNCTKGFPKEFSDETHANVNGYPIYRRRKGKNFNVKDRKINNAWVVPYNKYLLIKYQCHINVEVCASIKSIKYLFKYVYKGHDCANVEIKQKFVNNYQTDEVQSFLDARYVSAPEAIWRIFTFKMHSNSHAVIRLAVHLENEQTVYFEEGQVLKALELAGDRETTLTAWFELNRKNPEARKYFYSEIPEHFVFHKDTSSWEPRKKFVPLISRMFVVSLSDLERYFLRLILLRIKGATSFEDLRTVNDTLYATYREAAEALNLLADDTEWEMALEEAALFKMPYQLRCLFAYICIFCFPKNALDLWKKFMEDLTEDLIIKYPGNFENIAMADVQEILRMHGKSYIEFSLPKPSKKSFTIFYNAEQERKISDEMHKKLNKEQKLAYDEIMEVITSPKFSNCFFIDGPGGSGKTFLYTNIMHTLRGMGKVVIPVASTGIAATLLNGGRTVHSTFKLGLNISENNVSSIKQNFPEGKILREASLIIWDEVTMSSIHTLNAVDRLFKEIMNNSLPFGGKVIVIGGDFRQCLPVIKHGNRVEILQSSIKCSDLWKEFKHISLSKNMRSNEASFSKWLLNVGEGNANNSDNFIEINKSFLTKKTLIDEIYGESISSKNFLNYSTYGILCLTNDSTFEINNEILEKIDGEPKIYLSIDSIDSENEDEKLAYPVELLNTITFTGMPQHKLVLKKGCIVMLLRNINTKQGLCNGTKIIINDMKENILVGKILKGNKLGDDVFIPRIEIIHNSNDFPVLIRRRQFPIRLAFAITINKSQGQTFEKVGVFLDKSVFTHGQLYVALSRVKSKLNLKIQVGCWEQHKKLLETNESALVYNCVYKEILSDDIELKIKTDHSDYSNNFSDLSSSSETECFDSDSEIPLEEFGITYQHNLSKNAFDSLCILLNNDAYKSMDILDQVWNANNFDPLYNEIIVYLRSSPQLYYDHEELVSHYYYNSIRLNYSYILDIFEPIETNNDGNCFYSAISINLTGNQNLSTALRFATVGTILKYKNQLMENCFRWFSEAKKTIYGSYYNCLLEDLAFSSGIVTTLRGKKQQIKYPDRLNSAFLDPNVKSNFNWAVLFHQFIVSIILNRPIHCHGVFQDRAQRILWRYSFENSPPVSIVHLHGNHYVALLPKLYNSIYSDKYTYYCLFINEEENIMFRNRAIRPENEIPFVENQDVITLD